MIRPRSLGSSERRRAMLLAAAMIATGMLAGGITLLGVAGATLTGVLAAVAALGIGVGGAWLLRVTRPNRGREIASRLGDLLATAFDDTYTLLLAPRLPIRDTERLDGILIGPGGVRVITARDWHGRYRVRGQTWEFEAGRRGWIRCRTNPSFDAGGLASGFVRWAADRGFRDLPLEPALAFPLSQSRVVLEEPEVEVVTGDNAPWWANRIGRVRRLDEAVGLRLAAAIIEEAELHAVRSRELVAGRSI
ncbi:MAG TPA: hypothetical protein VLA59_08625 [Patescibacteria group bacterium]|nr:hypothetical protein [Patescibacteria group bacterium]